MKGILHAGFLSMEPSTGHVKAWVGGIDKRYFSYDHVRQSKRQVGSTIKPILYSLAINDGIINPCDEIPNMPYRIEKGKFGLMEDWQPDYSPQFSGMLSFKYGLANSMNNVAAYIMNKTSPEALVKQCQKMGITSTLNPTASLCLGTSDISLYEMVGAYGAFANDGVWNEPVYLLRIEDKYGNPIYTVEQEITKALNEETAYTMLDMMKGVVDGEYNEARGKKVEPHNVFVFDITLLRLSLAKQAPHKTVPMGGLLASLLIWFLVHGSVLKINPFVLTAAHLDKVRIWRYPFGLYICKKPTPTRN